MAFATGALATTAAELSSLLHGTWRHHSALQRPVRDGGQGDGRHRTQAAAEAAAVTQSEGRLGNPKTEGLL